MSHVTKICHILNWLRFILSHSCVCESNELVHKQIANIIHIDKDNIDAYPYLIRLNNLQHVRDWLTPFEIQKINY